MRKWIWSLPPEGWKVLAELAVDQQMVQQGRVNQLFLGVNIVNVLFKSLVSEMIFFLWLHTSHICTQKGWSFSEITHARLFWNNTRGNNNIKLHMHKLHIHLSEIVGPFVKIQIDKGIFPEIVNFLWNYAQRISEFSLKIRNSEKRIYFWNWNNLCRHTQVKSW